MIFRTNLLSNGRAVRIGSVVLFNIVIFIAAFHTIDISMSDELVAEEVVLPPRGAVLPHLTVTDEMKVDMFFDRLRIDHSVIKPKHIVNSINLWEPYIRRYSKQYGVDADLVRAIIYAESKGDPNCVSKVGAMGLMQIMPATAVHLGVSDVLDPEENIKAGVKYIAWLVKRYDEMHALWAWNAGPQMIIKQHIPNQTKKFIVEVLSVKVFLKDEGNEAI